MAKEAEKNRKRVRGGYGVRIAMKFLTVFFAAACVA